MARCMGVHYLLGFVLLGGFGIIRAQEYVILDEPELDIWDGEDQSPTAEADKILSVLCENYELTIKNEKIDCSSIQFKAKELLWDDSNHMISKREAGDDTELEEGSGNGEIIKPEVSLYNETSVNLPLAPPVDEPPVEEAPQEEQQESAIGDAPPIDFLQIAAANADTQQISEDAETKEQPAGETGDAPVVEPANVDGNEELPKESENEGALPESPEPQESDKAQAGPEDSAVVPELNVPAADETDEQVKNKESDSEVDSGLPPLVHDISRSETTIAPPAQSSEATTQRASTEAQEKEGGDKDESRAATQKVLPSDLAEVETTQKPKESEVVDDKQSANAGLLKQPTGAEPVPVEGSESDKHLASIATNAKKINLTSDSEQPNTGESAKNVSKAGKDTTILVVLFVAVLVIGAAVFTHNYIKKRKQKASENSEIVKDIRRSLQNLSSGNGKNSTDVEQGTEMKPLMKSNSATLVKEYTDTKKDVEA